MSGDNIINLPVNKKSSPKPEELEFMYNLFQPKNKQVIKATISPFKSLLLITIFFALFVFFNVPIINLAEKLGGKIIGKLIIIIIFFFIAFASKYIK